MEDLSSATTFLNGKPIGSSRCRLEHGDVITASVRYVIAKDNHYLDHSGKMTKKMKDIYNMLKFGKFHQCVYLKLWMRAEDAIKGWRNMLQVRKKIAK